jgi:hypothetical protein
MRLLEVIACSVEDARAAERGGAGRLEIVRSLEAGGLTPPLSLVREIVAAVSIPVRVMLRENAGYAASGEPEIEDLCRAAGEFAALGVDGLVLGFLQNRTLNLLLMERILRHAPGVKATFHRAFEELSDPASAITALKTLPQFDRILTSGAGADLAQLAADHPPTPPHHRHPRISRRPRRPPQRPNPRTRRSRPSPPVSPAPGWLTIFAFPFLPFAFCLSYDGACSASTGARQAIPGRRSRSCSSSR